MRPKVAWTTTPLYIKIYIIQIECIRSSIHDKKLYEYTHKNNVSSELSVMYTTKVSA